ncbi:MAG: glycosyl transferase, partial [Clostridia bacterium]|nr:glycosyl transferase [Clostridia bacterium]
MIPKKIHYCWFGGKPKPKLSEKCIASWRRFCPDYEIVEWNESNYDVTAHPYTKSCFERGM